MGSCEGTGDDITVPWAVFMKYKCERDLMGLADLDSTAYARTELSGKRRSEDGTSLPDRVEATNGSDNVHDDARDGREGGGRPGGDAVGKTVPASQGRDEPFLGDQQDGGGDGGYRGGRHEALHCGHDEMKGGGVDGGHDAETMGNYVANGEGG